MPSKYSKSNKSKIVKKCKKLATHYHKGQIRKFGDDKGKPYIIHPQRIASKFDDEILKSVAWLHDVIEDTSVTPEMLLELGVPDEIVYGVEGMSREYDETYLDFILRAKENLFACSVKIADIEDNMMSLKEGSLKDKYRMALYILEN